MAQGWNIEPQGHRGSSARLINPAGLPVDAGAYRALRRPPQPFGGPLNPPRLFRPVPARTGDCKG